MSYFIISKINYVVRRPPIKLVDIKKYLAFIAINYL